MRRFNSIRRIRRCRNVPSTSDIGSVQQISQQCDLEVQSENRAVAFERAISVKPHSFVLDHDDIFCQMCGVIPGDIDEVTEQKAEFRVGYINQKSFEEKNDLSNLRILCSTCYQGFKELNREGLSSVWLLSQVRRAGQDEQRAVLKWLREKFKD